MTPKSAGLAVRRTVLESFPQEFRVQTQGSEALEVCEIYMDGPAMVVVVKADKPETIEVKIQTTPVFHAGRDLQDNYPTD